MKQKNKLLSQIDEKKIDDLLEVTAKISELPLDKQMYVAGAIAALAAEANTNSTINKPAR